MSKIPKDKIDSLEEAISQTIKKTETKYMLHLSVLKDKGTKSARYAPVRTLYLEYNKENG